MISDRRNLKRRATHLGAGRVLAAALAMAALLAGFELQAQFPPGGFGGFGGGNTGGGSNQRGRTGSTTRQYPNNQGGDAVISIDPETRNLIVIADDDTSQYISQVIS